MNTTSVTALSCGAFAVTAGALLTVVGSRAPSLPGTSEVVTTRLRVVDVVGRDRAVLEVDEASKDAVLRMLDGNGACRMDMSVESDGSTALHMMNEEAAELFSIIANPFGSSVLLTEPKSGASISISIDPNGGMELSLRQSESTYTSTRVDGEASELLLTRKPAGSIRLQFDDERPVLTLVEDMGNSIAELRATKQDEGKLRLRDKQKVLVEFP